MPRLRPPGNGPDAAHDARLGATASGARWARRAAARWITGGSLIANGFVARGPSFTAKITGGTGRYKGARGTVTVVGGPTTKYTVRLVG
ncbi:MAG TPA: hypothetical protein VH210_10795 [Gaiellaceae bacterium]|jgi:hypothetical protein|nr:hypothetical protein [Gaiellaceae bacterium]